ncbi:MAG: MFS transporter, partial [Xanthomonadales bacterium]|nr:MFS transporter [Xanthomonadales bacterium]
ALFSLMRNIGSSIGISVVVTLLARNTQANHATMSEFLTRDSYALQQAIANGQLQMDSALGLAQLNQLLTREAATLAYLQDFRLMMWVALAGLPLLLLLRRPAASARPAPS